MITWNITISGQQIAMLRSLRHRKFGAEWSHPTEVRNWITTGRTLMREGLIEHIETKHANGYMDLTRSGHFITKRGRFILSMVEQDIAKFLDKRTAAALAASAEEKPVTRKLRRVS